MELSKTSTNTPPLYISLQGLPKAIFVNILNCLTIKEIGALCTITNALAQLLLKRANSSSSFSSIPFVFCIAHRHQNQITPLHEWEILRCAFQAIYKSEPEAGNAVLQEICARISHLDLSEEYADKQNEFKFYLDGGQFGGDQFLLGEFDCVYCNWKAIESVACFPNLQSLVLRGCLRNELPRCYGSYVTHYRHRFFHQALEKIKHVMTFQRKAVAKARISNNVLLIHGWKILKQGGRSQIALIKLARPLPWVSISKYEKTDTKIRETSFLDIGTDSFFFQKFNSEFV